MDCAISVFNLQSGEERVYVGISPDEAVIAAYMDSIGNHNTWEYPKESFKLQYGSCSVACGDWAALLNS